MRAFINLAIGLLFGFGLVLSGMADPEKVLGFLDVAGLWDPSLMLVMAGAIAVATSGYWLVLKRSSPVLEPRFDLPPTSPIDPSLLSGAAIFGVGWGLSGFCPGPAVVALPLASVGALVFAPAMLIGIAGAIFLKRRAVATAEG